MSQYSLLLMLNDAYIKLATLFLNSLHLNADLSKIKKIIINNIGISNANKSMLKEKYPKIEFYETNKSFGFSKMHSKEWLESLTYKTKSLRNVIQDETNLPLIMIDSDMLVLKDFHHFIDKDKDIQVCKREVPNKRGDLGFFMNYIASFLIIHKNSTIVKQFLTEWIQEIEEMCRARLKPAYETPSLCKMIEKYKTKMKIGELDEINISTDKKYVENATYIIHLKSTGKEDSIDSNFENRVNNVKKFSKDKIVKYLS